MNEKAHNDKLKLDRAAEAESIRLLMSTKAGRRWVWNTLATCECFIVSASLDPCTMAWEKGKRTIGNQLLASVTTLTPNDYIIMMGENSTNRNFNNDRPIPGATDDSNPEFPPDR